MALSSTLPTLKRAIVGAAAAAALFAADVAPSQAQVTQRDQGESDYHVVEDGDTMWDLSGHFYQDTYQWPRMWSHNSHITNPHWIYPGDIVYLREDGGGTGGSQAAGGEGDGEDGADTSQGEVQRGLFLPLGGYITKEDPQYVGRITASRKEANMLSEHDTAWVGWGDEAYSEDEKVELKGEDRHQTREVEDVSAGDRFAVVRDIGTIDNDDGQVIARKYRVLGAVEVTDTDEENYDEVRVTQSWHEMHRGDMLVPYERQLKVVKQSRAGSDEVARIIDTLQPGSIFGEHSYVFIDKGAADGVHTGNRFFVYQRYEGLHKSVDGKLDEKVPWSRVGQVLVLDVRENYSTAVIVDANREIVVGDRLEMYDGY